MPSSLPPEATSLFEQSQAGDDDAWSRLLGTMQPKMHRYARRALPAAVQTRESPSDIVQQTLVEAVRSRAAFRGSRAGDVAPWVFGILKNQIRLATRRHGGTGRRDIGREVSLADVGTGALPPAPAPASSVAFGPQMRAKVVMASLPDEDRQLLKWRLEEDMTFAEIGGRLGISEDAARVRHARLMADLRRRLKEHVAPSEPPPTEGA